MELKDLIGGHKLSGVDVTSEGFNLYGRDGDAVRFILDGKTYKAIEDPDDGYRSYLKELEVTDEKVTTNFPPQSVVGIMKSAGLYDSDVIQFVDSVTGKVVLEVGTEDVNDYYPCAIIRWSPENLAINSKDEILLREYLNGKGIAMDATFIAFNRRGGQSVINIAELVRGYSELKFAGNNKGTEE